MSNAARKARKRAGVAFVKPPKVATGRLSARRGFGMTSGAEIMAAIVVRDLFGRSAR